MLSSVSCAEIDTSVEQLGKEAEMKLGRRVHREQSAAQGGSCIFLHRAEYRRDVGRHNFIELVFNRLFELLVMEEFQPEASNYGTSAPESLGCFKVISPMPTSSSPQST